jgi:GTP diphosphokinase / guanosine-3',5'-bis(diphosphate) 3'-diphosphatase
VINGLFFGMYYLYISLSLNLLDNNKNLIEMSGFSGDNIVKLIRAIDFAALHHRKQRRKGLYDIPYINHPIKVARVLSETIPDIEFEILVAAILHDVIEDTPVTAGELMQEFGEYITSIVEEVTDDPNHSRTARWDAQIIKAFGLSDQAKLIKIADKVCNMRDILVTPLLWTQSRRIKYFKWAKQVVDGCRGVNLKLEALFDEVYNEGMRKWMKQ